MCTRRETPGPGRPLPALPTPGCRASTVVRQDRRGLPRVLRPNHFRVSGLKSHALSPSTQSFSLLELAANFWPEHSTYYPRAHQHFPIVVPNSQYLPQFPGAPPLAVFSQFNADGLSDSWPPYHSSPQAESPRHPIISPHNPTIRITETTGSLSFAQPPGGFVSQGIYHNSRQPQALQQNINSQYNFPQPFRMGSNILPDNMATPQNSSKHERASSINSINMPTPVSISDPRSPLVTPTSGERPLLISSPQSHAHSHSRNHSVSSSEPDVDEDGSLRKSYKRAEEPPRNEDGKYTCSHQECTDQIFDRKCEWR